jgi:putative 4-mercaptohistidine N1-methyltranferase
VTKTITDHTQQYRNALDIGCAVGGASFELGKVYDHVDAFDFSTSFVNAAKRMQTQPETVRFRIPMEADLYREVQAIHNDGVTPEVRAKVNFFTGDACQLDQMVQKGQLRTDYDSVIMSNLLCRLPDPVACLNGLSNIVNPNGVVVMVTPYSWLTEYTSRNHWLGGFYDPVTKEPIHSKDVLKELMQERGFMKIHEEPMPLLIREHQRKYQYIVSEATGWRKE